MKQNGNFQICDYAQLTVIITVKPPPETLQSAAVNNSFHIYRTIQQLRLFLQGVYETPGLTTAGIHTTALF